MPGMPGMGGPMPIPLPNPMGGDFGPGNGKRVVILNLPWQTSWQALKAGGPRTSQGGLLYSLSVYRVHNSNIGA